MAEAIGGFAGRPWESAFGEHPKGEQPVTYPVTFEADYFERRSRLTTFFRIILAIPLVILLLIYALLASIALLIAWFAIVLTARYPRGLYDFVAGYTRFLARSTAYVVLLSDPYPPLGLS